MNRRTVVKASALFAGGTILGHRAMANPKKRQLDILILGGTNFIGPAIVNSFLSGGHKVTLLNRGITNPQLFPG
ncbi:MAG TPA: hypothetical protein VG737_15895, partial [Cyclobacteriaceae bacterium]|nr:hypothetical protein [Cyclobacteriaceae bacterium]